MVKVDLDKPRERKSQPEIQIVEEEEQTKPDKQVKRRNTTFIA